MRLFIAISFPKELKEMAWKEVQQLKKTYPQISWVKQNNIHLTLKFLGKVEDSKLPKIKKAMSEAVKNSPPFKLNFTDYGYFDKGYLVVWLGIHPCRELLDLVSKIDEGTKKLGFSKEKRPYSPHITLGRGKRLAKPLTAEIKEEIKILNSPGITSYMVSEITLMQSSLSPKGAIYNPIAKFALS